MGEWNWQLVMPWDELSKYMAANRDGPLGITLEGKETDFLDWVHNCTNWYDWVIQALKELVSNEGCTAMIGKERTGWYSIGERSTSPTMVNWVLTWWKPWLPDYWQPWLGEDNRTCHSQILVHKDGPLHCGLHEWLWPINHTKTYLASLSGNSCPTESLTVAGKLSQSTWLWSYSWANATIPSW